jgi:hypothetical protein
MPSVKSRTQRLQKSFALLLGGQPLNNFGARKALAMKRQQRAVPFTKISVFGFVLDESGPKIMAAPVVRTGAAARCGGT